MLHAAACAGQQGCRSRLRKFPKLEVAEAIPIVLWANVAMSNVHNEFQVSVFRHSAVQNLLIHPDSQPNARDIFNLEPADDGFRLS